MFGCSIDNCLLYKNPGNKSPLVKNKSLIHEAVNAYIIIYTVYNMYKCE